MNHFSYVHKNGLVEFSASGEMSDVVVEIVMMCHKIYNSILRQNKDAADEFRYAVIRAIVDPKSPIWEPAKDIPGETFICVVQEKK